MINQLSSRWQNSSTGTEKPTTSTSFRGSASRRSMRSSTVEIRLYPLFLLTNTVVESRKPGARLTNPWRSRERSRSTLSELGHGYPWVRSEIDGGLFSTPPCFAR